ncbi:MAG: hypothetical protein IJ608_01125 [Lachnospiraceae bacterium]|nr:hypothetical protein [Lachnospiraceae bacterium]
MKLPLAENIGEIEKFIYGGISLMVLAIVLAVLCIIVFSITGKRIKKRLTKEYGEPEKYGLQTLKKGDR